MERYLRVKLLGPGPRLVNERIYWAADSQRLSNTGLIGCRRYEAIYCLLLLQVSSWTFRPFKIRTLRCLETSRIDYPVTQHDIPEKPGLEWTVPSHWL